MRTLLLLVPVLAACNTALTNGSECDVAATPDPCFDVGLACVDNYIQEVGLCTAPQELFACQPEFACASGLTCVGGDGGVCLVSCATDADCWDTMTSCRDAGSGLFCQPTPCSEIWQPCTASNPDGGDGTCIIANWTSSGPVGACLQGGNVPNGGVCNYFRAPDAGLCVPGTVCETNVFTGANVGVCMSVCDDTLADGGPACSGGCSFASPPSPDYNPSSLDFFSRIGGCSTLCDSNEQYTDAGCPNGTVCVPTGENPPLGFECLP